MVKLGPSVFYLFGPSVEYYVIVFYLFGPPDSVYRTSSDFMFSFEIC